LTNYVKRVFQADGEVLVSAPPPAPAAPAVPYLIPTRKADFVLECRPVAVADRTYTFNSNSGYTSDTSSSQEANSMQSSCRSTGWQNIRESVSVWIAEKRCNGELCSVDDVWIRYRGRNINRVTGQFQDTCFAYQCERAKSGVR
jgi:hypothetical protein